MYLEESLLPSKKKMKKKNVCYLVLSKCEYGLDNLLVQNKKGFNLEKEKREREREIWIVCYTPFFVFFSFLKFD